MNQLTITNKNDVMRFRYFTLETSIMEKIFDASGYNFHVLTIDGHKWWIGKELAHAFGFTKDQGSMNMFNSMDRKDFHTIRLTNANGMKELKKVLYEAVWDFKTHTGIIHWTERSIKRTPFLALVREDTLQEYLTLYTRNPDAKEIGKKLYEYFTQPKTLVEVFEEESNPLKDILYTEAERLDLSKEFMRWYWGMVRGIYWFEKLDYRSNMLNGLKCLIANYTTLESRYMVVTGKNSAKKILKKQGASFQMISSYLRRWNRSERMYNWQMSQSLRFHFSLNWG